MRVMVTGAAGFIGFHVSQRLLARGDEVVGVDNLNDYYDPSLKDARLVRLYADSRFRFLHRDIADRVGMEGLFSEERPEAVIHLAAQAGVRYSLQNPRAFVDANLVGFMNVLEGCRHSAVDHLVFASSSSVYGANTKLPYSIHDNVDHPISLYAATKKANELLAHSYSHLYRIPTTGLRFFTVYGPWGRPDMAAFRFTRAILAGEPIDVYNDGHMWRDFTYIDDIVEGVIRVLDRPPASQGAPVPDASMAPCRLYNIGNHQPVELLDFIAILERCLGREARKNFLPLQSGDVLATYADITDLVTDVGFAPATPIEVGLERFVTWYRWYYEERSLPTTLRPAGISLWHNEGEGATTAVDRLAHQG